MSSGSFGRLGGPGVMSLRGRWRRLVTLLVMAVALGAGVVVASPASAMAWDMCKDAPPPVRPDYGTAGLTTGPRDLSKVPDVAPNPFADKTIPISEVYGYAYRWTNYDLGCGNDFVRDPVAVTTTTSRSGESTGGSSPPRTAVASRAIAPPSACR